MQFLFKFWHIFKKEALILIIAAFDKRTPKKLKALLALAVLYLFSPIDVIFDGVPFVGLLDDFLIVPTLFGAVAKFVPPEVKEKSRDEANKWLRYVPWIFFGILVVLLLWLMLIFYVFYRVLFT